METLDRRSSDEDEDEGIEEEEEKEEYDCTDLFDRLPDPLIVVILNLVGDVKALGRCSASSRRFRSLVPLVDNVLVRVDCVITDDPSSSTSTSSTTSSSDKNRNLLSGIARLFLGGLAKVGQILLSTKPSSSKPSSSSSSSSSQVSHHSPAEVLKSFRELRRLRIQLPAAELGVDPGVLLKWKASFGSSLDSCVILGAASKSPNPTNPTPDDHDHNDHDSSGSIPESFYTNGSLKLRVVWTISSLIAASARHFLLQPIITDHETLESLDLTDADGQGMLTMDAVQLRELRTRPVSASGSSQRTLVPALSMKLWYASRLEIPGGEVLTGATLVAIRPTEEEDPQKERMREARGGDGGGGGCWVSDAFEEPYRTAARMLVKRRTYCLEMNSF
ncbi:putative F-box protein [Iris pallida]|uniref:F-box protein n=1 Tax=Iris pallida TaxID=29817 RepID=A0AAX6HAG1_IRIPA|nr:putative F-box protein [Iris pallida]